MADRVDALLEELRNNPKGLRFADLLKVCEHFFGSSRVKGSHHIFSMPWPGDPRVNIQNDGGGKAKAYQVQQVIKAIDTSLR